jgi:hypothetical protein
MFKRSKSGLRIPFEKENVRKYITKSVGVGIFPKSRAIKTELSDLGLPRLAADF